MSLSGNAVVTNTEEVWYYLGATESEKVELEPYMEGWINAASFQLERMCKRRIVARNYINETQDGNGRNYLNVSNYPIINIDGVTIEHQDGLETYVLNVERDLRVDKRAGKLEIKPRTSPVSTFFKGTQNIVLNYRAGFAGHELEVFKAAVLELILIFWRERGGDPLSQQRNDSLGSSVFTTRFDPKKLPFHVQRAVYEYGSHGF